MPQERSGDARRATARPRQSTPRGEFIFITVWAIRMTRVLLTEISHIAARSRAGVTSNPRQPFNRRPVHHRRAQRRYLAGVRVRQGGAGRGAAGAGESVFVQLSRPRLAGGFICVFEFICISVWAM